MADSRLTMEKLNNTIFNAWKFEMKMLLVSKQLWKYVSEEKPVPLPDNWSMNNDEALATIAIGCQRS